MPLYTVMTEAGVLDEAGRRRLAGKLTTLHCEYAGVAPNWVHIVFNDYAAGYGFTAGRASALIALTLCIRSGRSDDYKRDFLARIWTLLQEATRLPDEAIVIGIQELPASQAMEMGKIMPNVSTALTNP